MTVTADREEKGGEEDGHDMIRTHRRDHTMVSGDVRYGAIALVLTLLVIIVLT
jgi:hypothetical protein